MNNEHLKFTLFASLPVVMQYKGATQQMSHAYPSAWPKISIGILQIQKNDFNQVIYWAVS